jgi:hypothetical protein
VVILEVQLIALHIIVSIALDSLIVVQLPRILILIVALVHMILLVLLSTSILAVAFVLVDGAALGEEAI